MNNTAGPDGPGTARNQIEQTIAQIGSLLADTEAAYRNSGCSIPVPPPPHNAINVLIVTDGTFDANSVMVGQTGSFGDPDSTDRIFTLSTVVKALNTITPGFMTIDVKTAHRQRDPLNAADLNGIKFDEIDLSFYDQIWLIGVAAPGEGVPEMTESELQAIARFMDGGGGVFATGDHADLGAPLSGRVLRVRSMRKWYFKGDPSFPAGAPDSWSPPLQDGPNRHDTLRPGHSDPPPANGIPQLPFDDQSDDIPQSLVLPPPFDLNPHPLLAGPSGAIVQFPDHMHEGEVLVPWTLTDQLTFNGQRFTEYPARGTLRPSPVVVANATVIAHDTLPSENHTGFGGPADVAQPTTFGVVGAYNGREVGVGRVAVDSTWHHFFDINLIGDPAVPSFAGVDPRKAQGFLASTEGKAVLAGMRAYYRNIAVWLARSTTHAQLWSSAVRFIALMHPLNEILLRGRSYDDVQMQRVGEIGVALLTRFVPSWVVAEMITAHAAGTSLIAAAAPEGSLQGAPIEAMTGGALVAVTQQKAGVQTLSDKQTHDMVSTGMANGLAALRRVLDGSAKATADRIKRMEAAEAEMIRAD